MQDMLSSRAFLKSPFMFSDMLVTKLEYFTKLSAGMNREIVDKVKLAHSYPHFPTSPCKSFSHK